MRQVQPLKQNKTNKQTKKPKNKIMSFAATRMGLEIIILSEISQTEKDKSHNDIVNMQSLKK